MVVYRAKNVRIVSMSQYLWTWLYVEQWITLIVVRKKIIFFQIVEESVNPAIKASTRENQIHRETARHCILFRSILLRLINITSDMSSVSVESSLLLLLWTLRPSKMMSRWVCFFIRTDLEKCSISSLAHQWMLCSEWVPSEWESKHLIKTSQ